LLDKILALGGGEPTGYGLALNVVATRAIMLTHMSVVSASAIDVDSLIRCRCNAEPKYIFEISKKKRLHAT
jgi:hypothetical protein